MFYLKYIIVSPQNYFKNKRWAAFLDSYYFLIGLVANVLTGSLRYLLSSMLYYLLGYRVYVSTYPKPMHKLDSLYKSFYATLILHCLRLGLEPEDLDDDTLSIGSGYNFSNF